MVLLQIVKNKLKKESMDVRRAVSDFKKKYNKKKAELLMEEKKLNKIIKEYKKDGLTKREREIISRKQKVLKTRKTLFNTRVKKLGKASLKVAKEVLEGIADVGEELLTEPKPKKRRTTKRRRKR